jgi:hypothetical protein
MGDITKGDTFLDGQPITGDRLNALVDAAVINPTLISDKTLITPVAGDVALVFEASSGLLRKASAAGAGAGVGTVNSVGLALPGSIFSVSGSPVTNAGTLTGALLNQVGNKVLAAPADGSSGVPTFRVLTPKDVPAGTSTLSGTVVDWSLAPTFILNLTGNITLTFLNNAPGLSIKVWANGLFSVIWPTVLWPNSVTPTQDTNTLWEFTQIGNSAIFGRATTIN